MMELTMSLMDKSRDSLDLETQKTVDYLVSNGYVIQGRTEIKYIDYDKEYYCMLYATKED